MQPIQVEAVSAKEITTKYGTRYRIGLKTKNAQGVESWINGLMKYKPNWQGQTIDLEVYEDPQYGWQFKAPKNIPVQSATPPPVNRDLLARIEKLEKKVFGSQVEQLANAFGEAVEPKKELTVDDIPF